MRVGLYINIHMFNYITITYCYCPHTYTYICTSLVLTALYTRRLRPAGYFTHTPIRIRMRIRMPVLKPLLGMCKAKTKICNKLTSNSCKWNHTVSIDTRRHRATIAGDYIVITLSIEFLVLRFNAHTHTHTRAHNTLSKRGKAAVAAAPTNAIMFTVLKVKTL